jgi:hypothetical protein
MRGPRPGTASRNKPEAGGPDSFYFLYNQGPARYDRTILIIIGVAPTRLTPPGSRNVGPAASLLSGCHS